MLASAFRPILFLPPSPTRTGVSTSRDVVGGGGGGSSSSSSSSSSSAAAFLLPSPGGSASLRNVDVASRRRLDRRTMYHGLMAELGGGGSGAYGGHHQLRSDDDDGNGSVGGKKMAEGGSARDGKRRRKDNSVDSMIRRRYLDPDTARSLKGALGLACQPKWREKLAPTTTTAATAPVVGTRIDDDDDAAAKGEGGENEEDDDGGADVSAAALPSWWHRGGVCLFPQGDEASPTGGGRRWPTFRRSQSFVGGQDRQQQQQQWGMGSGDGGGPPQRGFFGPEQANDDENIHNNGATSSSSLSATNEKSSSSGWRCTMGMQETVAMALAHSLSCGLALIDDEALAGVRESVERSLAELVAAAAEDMPSTAMGDEGERGRGDGDDASVIAQHPPLPSIDPEELRNSALLGHLVRLANEGKLGRGGKVAKRSDTADSGSDDDLVGDANKGGGSFGRISHRMTRDMELGLDDPNDELAVESLRLMKEDEKHWFNYIDEKSIDHSTKNPLSLVLFLRCDSSPSILKSKSAVERLAQECVRKDGIHLVMLGGKGIDASTTSLPDKRGQAGSGGANGRMMNRQQSVLQQQQDGGEGGGSPFSFLSNFPPGSPEFNAGGQPQQPGGGSSFSANNANASGVNDPEGSRRFNIFLARTVDSTGKPQIMGTIASPQAGNLFPAILANMAKENLRKIQEDGIDEDNEEQARFVKQMEDLASQAQQHADQAGDNGNYGSAGDGALNAAFFNATITSPFGSEIFNRMNQQYGEDGSPAEQQFQPPQENVRRAIQDAMSGVIQRLAQMSASASSNVQGMGSAGIPANVARAFSQVLNNESLRRGIAENLSRAAPALIDPRCQGVMLSVYVPPGPDHPNKGMMPGDQFKQGQTASPQIKTSQQQQQRQVAEKNDVPHGMGGWLNKILSSSDKGKNHNEVEDHSSLVPTVESDDCVTVDTSPSVLKGYEAEDKPSEEESSIDQQDASKPPKQSSLTKVKKSKRERTLDRAQTLAVAAAALAGAKKNRKEIKQPGVGNRPLRAKLTPEQKAERNLNRLQALCRRIPLPAPLDPVRLRSWDAWADREEGSVIFRSNKRTLSSHLSRRNLTIDSKSGTKGAGIVLRQMMSVRDISEEEMEDVIKCAVEIEAGKSQRHQESPWGVTKQTSFVKTTLATDKSLVNFLHDNTTTAGTDCVPMTTQSIHPNSLESALSLICGVSPAPGSHGSMSSSSGGVLASHRTKEDLMALAQDKHERALIPNCVLPQDIGVTYDMIGGLDEVKELLRQSITYPLKFPHLYSEGIAREAVKGVLLFGPPGTGKTMLAKAVATEGGASFLSVDASSVENKWLGESEKNAKAVFTLARRLAPCVIFIDEVDSLLSSREGSSDDSAHGTLTSVKTTMMSEWDGLNSGTNGKGDAGSDRVVVIGSTNRPFDLDEAVLRRFPRRILVDLPDLDTRREILEVTLAENRLGPDVNLTKIAERLEGYTGSDLKEVCREAVVQISHEQARMLDRGELLDEDDEEYLETARSGFQMLRPVTMKDFDSAMHKLKRSVSETGRELAKVWNWNDEYGEIKKTNKREVLPQMMNMFL